MRLVRIGVVVLLFFVVLVPTAMADVVVPSDSGTTSLDPGTNPIDETATPPSPTPKVVSDVATPDASDVPTGSPSPSPEASPNPSPDTSPIPSPSPSPTSSPSPSTEPTVSIGDLGVALSGVDFSDATVSQAGPDALYIRGVKVQGVSASLLFKKGDDELWKIVQAVPEKANFFPSGLVLDFARLEKLADGSLQLNGIFVEGQPYSAIIQVNDQNALTLTQPLNAGSLVGASLTRARTIAQYALKDELVEAAANKAKIDENQRMTQEMLANIGNLEKANRAADEEKAKLNDQITTLEARNKALDQEVADLKSEIDTIKRSGVSTAAIDKIQDADLKKVLQTLSDNVVSLQQQVKDLQTKLAGLASGTSTATSANTGVTLTGADLDKQSLQNEIKRLSALNENLMVERQNIERTLRAQFLSTGYIATAKPDLKQSVLKGFGLAKPQIGTWKVATDSAAQTSASQYFAQLDLPLVQKRETLLYSFTARATGKDWVGFGLHIYASGNHRQGYGHGKSLLVWLTRDPDYYKNNGTYLQLYRSDDDVNMGRVLDAAIQDPISSDMKIDILYQPVDEYITVAVNGVEKIRYKTWFSIDQGVEVSLRSLNSALFKDLEVFAPNK